MSRLPPQTRDELKTDDEREFFDYMDDFSKKHFDENIFKSRQQDGSFLGPYAPLQYTPQVGRHFFQLFSSIAQLEGLAPKAREVAILVTGTKYQAAYELYAHRRMGVAKGLTGEEVDEICLGDKPSTLDEQSAMAYDVSKELLDCEGPLSDSTWNDGVKVLGREGMTALIHFIGTYAYVSILLNGFDCKLPEGEKL